MMSESTMSEHEMKYYGKVTKPSEERIREIYGDDISQFMNRKPKRSSGKHELTSQIDDIRNGRGKYAPTIKSKRPKPFKLDQDGEAYRRDLPSVRKENSGGGVSLGLIMAMVGGAIVLLLGMMIYGAVENSVDTNYGLNATSGYPQHEYKDPFEMLLEPFEILSDKLGALVGLDDFPLWATLPLIFGIFMLVFRAFGSLTARGEY
jgi:hypothetical protein